MPEDQKQTILNKLLRAAESLADLRVTTCVGDVRVSVSATNRVSLTNAPDGLRAIYTSVNLITGDMTNAIHDEFADPESPNSLLDFHQEQVKNGRDIVTTNFQMVKELVSDAKDTVAELLRGTSSEREQSE